MPIEGGGKLEYDIFTMQTVHSYTDISHMLLDFVALITEM